jgi:uncharacterized FlgJ-related protein
MSDNGVSIFNNSIANGIKKVQIKIEQDKDYQTIIKEIEKSVFI